MTPVIHARPDPVKMSYEEFRTKMEGMWGPDNVRFWELAGPHLTDVSAINKNPMMNTAYLLGTYDHIEGEGTIYVEPG